MRSSLSIAAVLALTASSAFAVGPCSCQTDLNVDGVTDASDLAIVLGAWGGTGDADFDANGTIDAADLAILLGAWGPCAPPPNDDCGNAIMIPAFGPLTEFCNAAATMSPVAFPTCEGVTTPVGKDVWYRYVTPYSGVLQVHTCNSTFDTVLAVYGSIIQGACACPSNGINFATVRGCSDDSPSCGVGSFVEIPVGADECLTFRIAGYNYSGNVSEGYGELFINPIKTGDRCDIAHELGNAFNVTVPGTNAGDTSVQADPSSCANNDIYDEWYRYTMPCEGTLTISTCDAGTDYDTTLAVYSDCGGANSEIACNDDSTEPGCQIAGLNRKSLLVINAAGGETVYIRVSGFNGSTGNFVLNLSAHCNG